MKRRELITLLGGVAASWPLAARAQQPKRMRRIGLLMGDSSAQPYVTAFVQALRTLGWIDGENLSIDVRWNADERPNALAAELVGLAPDAILCAFTLNLMALQQATRSVPIVFLQVSDPIAQGFVASLSRPGGNLTGFTNFEFSIGGKWVELLKQIAPGLLRVAVMFNPDRSPQSKYFPARHRGRRTKLRGAGGRGPGALRRRDRVEHRRFLWSAGRLDSADRRLHHVPPEADRRSRHPPSASGGYRKFQQLRSVWDFAVLRFQRQPH